MAAGTGKGPQKAGAESRDSTGMVPAQPKQNIQIVPSQDLSAAGLASLAGSRGRANLAARLGHLPPPFGLGRCANFLETQPVRVIIIYINGA